jgi:hypothetical protein
VRLKELISFLFESEYDLTQLSAICLEIGLYFSKGYWAAEYETAPTRIKIKTDVFIVFYFALPNGRLLRPARHSNSGSGYVQMILCPALVNALQAISNDSSRIRMRSVSNVETVKMLTPASVNGAASDNNIPVISNDNGPATSRTRQFRSASTSRGICSWGHTTEISFSVRVTDHSLHDIAQRGMDSPGCSLQIPNRPGIVRSSSIWGMINVSAAQ